MCIGYPGRVVAIDASGAAVETQGRLRRASTLVLPDVRVGDWVTVAAGTIVERLTPQDAAWIRDRLDAAQDPSTHTRRGSRATRRPR